MKTSRSAAVIAASLLAVGVTACGSNDQNGGSASSTSTPPTAAMTSGEPVPTDLTPGTTGATAGNGKARAPLEPRNIEPKTKGVVANPDGPTSNVLDMYADAQCPFCKVAEEKTGAAVQKAADAKTVRVVYHPMTFLDQATQNDSSTTMANALVCASDAKGKLLPFLKEMFALQPEKEGDGYPADAPRTVADKIGLTGAERTTYDDCVSTKAYVPWIDSVQQQYADDGIKGTPTYRVNGEAVDFKNLDLPAFEKKLAGGK